MKPLSPINYFRNNKKGFIASIIAISLAVILIYGVDCLLESTFRTGYDCQGKLYEKTIEIKLISQSNSIKEKLQSKLNQNEYMEKIVPVRCSYIKYQSVGISATIPICGILLDDRDYVINKYNIAIKEGRLPEEGKKEIALDSRVAINNRLSVGDFWEEYEVVGLLTSEYFMSFSSFSSNKEEAASLAENLRVARDKLVIDNALVFPKGSNYDQVYDLFSDFSKDEVKCVGLQDVKKGFLNFSKSFNQIFDALVVLIIIVNVITLTCTKYAQFVNRKNEYGILNSLGYSRREIMNMALKEVIFLNGIAFIIGIILAVTMTYLLTKVVFASIGGIMIFIRVKGFLLSILTPLFTSIFTLIPIFRSLGNMDGISMVDEN